ncbi:MAG: hypothetical protein HY704_05685 [Gemmatimonadetes bacterium]|nr:hypothetical protein [Gemmatimonadota bacterium]
MPDLVDEDERGRLVLVAGESNSTWLTGGSGERTKIDIDPGDRLAVIHALGRWERDRLQLVLDRARHVPRRVEERAARAWQQVYAGRADRSARRKLGQGAKVRTIWIVDRGQEAPRLATAYAQEG